MEHDQEEIVKILIEMATDLPYARKVLDLYYPHKTLAERVNLITKMFKLDISKRYNNTSDEKIYMEVLTLIVEKKHVHLK